MPSERLVPLMELLQAYAHLYLQKSNTLAIFVDGFGLQPEQPLVKDSKRLNFLKETLVELAGLCAKGELPVTGVAINAALFALQFPTEESTRPSVLKSMLETIINRLPDELSTKLFLQVPHSKKEYFDEPLSGWKPIVDRFDACTRNIEEMNKCFALSRYTAAMYHALQIAELGAIELGDKIGVTDPKKGWGPTVRRLQEIVKGGHSKFDKSLGFDFEFVEQMNREVDSMVLAWRHKVDHAANHLAILPNSDFTPDVAEHIMKSVRVFMNRLVDAL